MYPSKPFTEPTYNELGLLHNEDGPTKTYFGTGYPRREFFHVWYLDGIEYTFEEWCKKLKKPEKEIFLLKLMYF